MIIVVIPAMEENTITALVDSNFLDGLSSQRR